MRKRMCRYIGLSSVTLYHGNRSNSKAEWNEALEGAYEVYFEPNFVSIIFVPKFRFSPSWAYSASISR